MDYFLLSSVIGLFIAMLFINLYFRVKAFKKHKILVQNNVDFGGVHFFDTKKLEEEVLPLYPEHRETILEFVHNVRLSVKLNTIFLVLITLFGGILMYDAQYGF